MVHTFFFFFFVFTCSSTCFTEQWLIKFEAIDSKSLVTLRLKHISDFFYNVLCAFVIRDFNMLLERYLKKTRQAYVSPL